MTHRTPLYPSAASPMDTSQAHLASVPNWRGFISLITVKTGREDNISRSGSVLSLSSFSLPWAYPRGLFYYRCHVPCRPKPLVLAGDHIGGRSQVDCVPYGIIVGIRIVKVIVVFVIFSNFSIVIVVAVSSNPPPPGK